MGNINQLYLQIEDWRHPDVAPVLNKPAHFDPLAGFPKGRKKRLMVATQEELDKFDVEIFYRDYCAHKYLKAMKCMRANSPFWQYNCAKYKHSWEVCQWEDAVMRMKEYEREKRLLKREKALRLKAEEGVQKNS